MKKGRNQELIVSLDNIVLFSYLGLCLIGAVIMFDITSMQSSLVNVYRHVIYLFVSWLSVILILRFFNAEKLRGLNPYFIYGSLALLVAVLIWGVEIKGAKRLLDFYLFTIQPSFFARLALVFFFASYIAKKQEELHITNIKQLCYEYAAPIVYTVTIFALILMEKHLSAIVISGTVLLGMLIYGGIRKRFVLSIFVIALLMGSLIIIKGEKFRSSRLKTYKVYSLLFKDKPDSSSSADKYQVLESLTALTSGSVFGTGIGRGRAKHYYLPEARTDYIYTVIGEEFGFIGAILVLGLHALLFFRIFKIAEAQENKYYKYLCAGLGMNIFLNALVNTGVAMSILPATGNTLPFISYGGTALLVDSISIGVVLNISAKRRHV